MLSTRRHFVKLGPTARAVAGRPFSTPAARSTGKPDGHMGGVSADVIATDSFKGMGHLPEARLPQIVPLGPSVADRTRSWRTVRPGIVHLNFAINILSL